MKKFILLTFCIFFVNFVLCQKEDYNWFIGNFSFEDGHIKNQFTFNPNLQTIDTFYQDLINTEQSNASISDSLGNPVIYTNGRAILDANSHSLIKNGDSINYNFSWDAFGRTYSLSRQGVLILPSVGTSNEYVMFTLVSDTMTINSNEYWRNVSLNTCEIYYDDSNELAVKNKNNILIKDTLGYGGLTACRHGNGRDWWIVCSEGASTCIYVYYMTKDTIYLDHKDCGFQYQFEGGGLFASFSPNGNYLARGSSNSGLEIFNFNRCSGALTLKSYIPRSVFMDTIADPFFYYVGHNAFSPNSRYIYTGPAYNLYQFDLESPNIINDKVLVGSIPKDSLSSYGVLFSTNGPDGKLYHPNGSTKKYHVMHNPDNYGVVCNIELNVPLPKPGSGSFGNFPNFRLGPLTGSACDTLGVGKFIKIKLS